jgi:hypothetical protein
MDLTRYFTKLPIWFKTWNYHPLQEFNIQCFMYDVLKVINDMILIQTKLLELDEEGKIALEPKEIIG